jgi:hypothetical protein
MNLASDLPVYLLCLKSHHLRRRRCLWPSVHLISGLPAYLNPEPELLSALNILLPIPPPSSIPVKGKTFILITQRSDSVARLRAYLYHALADAQVRCPPFRLQHRGKTLRNREVLKVREAMGYSVDYLMLVLFRKHKGDESGRRYCVGGHQR